jgi:hypothetical protein
LGLPIEPTTGAAKKLGTLLEDEPVVQLRKARAQLASGDINLATYRDLEAVLLQHPDFVPANSYSVLMASAPSPPLPAPDRSDDTVSPSGFLSVRHEEQYLQSLDAFLEGNAPVPRSHAITTLSTKNGEKPTEREREMQLKNPVSVYNWLRKNHPTVFLQDNETGAEKTPRPAGSRSSARKPATKDNVKQEQDLYDEDGIARDSAPSSRGKRKRDEDGGYRPKGGSSRSAKRRRDTTSKDESANGRNNKRAKKLSIDVR